MAKAKVTYFFNRLYETVKNYKDDMENITVTDHNKYFVLIKDITNKLKDAVKNYREFDPTVFIDDHDIKLYRIHNILSKNDYSIYIDKELMKNVTSPHDILFMNILKVQNVENRLGKLTSVTFNKFVKGITYFESDHVQDNPIYHRETSCGDKTRTHVDKFVLRISNSSLDKERKQRAAKMCYIERLIYDQIHENIYRTQDIGHKLEIHNMERLYMEYFPMEPLTVTVEFDDVYPVKVIINYGKYTEEYYKPYNKQWGKRNEKVYCKKTQRGMKFDKVQTYESGDVAWMPQDGGKRRIVK